MMVVSLVAGEKVTYGPTASDQQQRTWLGEVVRAESCWGTRGFWLKPLSINGDGGPAPRWWPAGELTPYRAELWQYDLSRSLYRRRHVSHDPAGQEVS